MYLLVNIASNKCTTIRKAFGEKKHIAHVFLSHLHNYFISTNQWVWSWEPLTKMSKRIVRQTYCFFLFLDSMHSLLLANYASLYIPYSILLLVTHKSPGVRQSRMFQSLKCLSEQMRTGEKQDFQLRLQRGNINVFMRKAILQWDQENRQRVCAHHHSWSVGTVKGAGYCGKRLQEYHYYCFTVLMQWTTTYGDRNNITNYSCNINLD